jgi:hypothetical protein
MGVLIVFPSVLDLFADNDHFEGTVVASAAYQGDTPRHVIEMRTHADRIAFAIPQEAFAQIQHGDVISIEKAPRFGPVREVRIVEGLNRGYEYRPMIPPVLGDILGTLLMLVVIPIVVTGFGWIVPNVGIPAVRWILHGMP